MLNLDSKALERYLSWLEATERKFGIFTMVSR
jgi:hypothetical protein